MEGDAMMNTEIKTRPIIFDGELQPLDMEVFAEFVKESE